MTASPSILPGAASTKADPYYARLTAVYAMLQAQASEPLPGDPVLLARLLPPQPAEAGYQAPDTTVEDITSLPSASGEYAVRVYRPRAAPAGAPVVVWAHGGAWVGGDIDMPEADAVARELCTRAGAVVVSVDYRLCRDGVHFPAPHDDYVAAVHWAAQHAKRYGGDPDRIVIGGASAGANLAAGAALRLRDERLASAAGGVSPRALLLAYPAVHTALPEPSAELALKLAGLPPAMSFTPEIYVPIVENYIGAPAAQSCAYAAPGIAGDLAGLPATLIINCEYDGLRSSGEAFAARLTEAGVRTRLLTAPDVAHGHLNRPGLPQAQASLADMTEWIAAAQAASMRVVRLRTLHRTNPLGIDETPEFSWHLESDRRGVVQRSYELTVTDGDGVVWTSGVVHSDQQSFVRYDGELAPRTRYCVSVTVTDNHGDTASASAWFETALLGGEWAARWVESTIPRAAADGWGFGTQPPPVEFLRGFDVRGPVSSARLYATALGVYRGSLNGERLDDRELAPEFSVYSERLYYQTYDVARLLRPGRNELSLYVGDGWYHCPITRPFDDTLRTLPAVLFQLEVTYADGTRETIASDGTELCRTGPVLSSDLYWGEQYDASAGVGAPQRVALVDGDVSPLVAQPLDPVRATETLPARRVYTTADGETIVDFEQVIAGRTRVRIDVPRGREVTFEHFEVTRTDGGYINTMYAGQKVSYVSDGTPATYEPLFTFHGFRYVRVTGMDEVRAEDFTAVVLTTPKERTGWFASSDARLNRLHENVRWSQRNNMMSIPTDCPSREKAGFTGDIQLYAPAGLRNEDLTSFLTAWLRNLRADQREDGVVPMTVPFTAFYERLARRMSAEHGADGASAVTGIAGWGDAVVIVPWEMYQATANTGVLAENYAAMQAWCDYVLTTAREQRGDPALPEDVDRHLWNTGFHFGEWLIPSQQQEGGDFEPSKESARYVAPFFGYRSVSLFADVAEVLGRHDDAARYRRHAEQMRAAIHAAFMTGPRMPVRFMGAYVLAFAFGLVPDARREDYAAALSELVEANGRLLDTGFLATPYLLDALTQIGRRDLAMALLWADRPPSWLYQVDMGATAIWENWEAVAPDGTPTISSYDHYAFGCVDDWICREVAGIKPAAPGFRRVVIAPGLDSGLTSCERRLLTEHGEISVAWTPEQLTVMIPCGVSATVRWAGAEHHIGSGTYTF